MTKNIIILSLSIIAILGCSNSINNVNDIDPKLIGSWNAKITKTQNPISKTWKIKRNSDGTFSSDEILKIANRSQNIKRSGKWWTQNGIYYLQDERNKDTLTYKYSILNAGKVKFNSTKDSLEFVETKE
ncbi:hypothetical protein [Halpernia sp.]|uniref:hypothetical protein n=1 Tax=Halpernia sp. TaxID=2782209 RepID=UPI003A94E138